MIDGWIRAIVMGYGIAGSLTVTSLLFFFGPKLVRAVLRELGNLKLENWPLVPIVGLFGLFGGMIGLWIAGVLWPGTVFFLIRHRKGEKERQLRERDQEFESILDEIRHLQKERTHASHNG